MVVLAPIQESGDLFRNGELFDGAFDGALLGMEDLGPPGGTYAGFSHQLVMMFSNLAAAPGGTEARGDYELDETLLDDSGNGWRIDVSFPVR